jgi:hypothetical protein
VLSDTTPVSAFVAKQKKVSFSRVVLVCVAGFEWCSVGSLAQRLPKVRKVSSVSVFTLAPQAPWDLGLPEVKE